MEWLHFDGDRADHIADTGIRRFLTNTLVLYTDQCLTLDRTHASCERRTKCADSATYEVTDPEVEP